MNRTGLKECRPARGITKIQAREISLWCGCGWKRKARIEHRDVAMGRVEVRETQEEQAGERTQRIQIWLMKVGAGTCQFGKV